MDHTPATEGNDVLIEGILELGEELVWSHPASPWAGFWSRASLGFFGIVWLAALGFVWLKISSTGSSGSGSLLTVHLILAAFAIVGLGFVLSPVFAWHRARSTIYAVTNQRLIFLHRFPWRKIHSVAPGEIDRIEVSPDPELFPVNSPRGSVFFQHDVVGRRNRWGGHTTERIGFRDVPDHVQVAEMIRHLQSTGHG